MILLLAFVLYAIILSAALWRAGHRSLPQLPSGSPGGAPERILIVGATGGTGRQIVIQALERGLSVRAFVRDPSRLAIEHQNLEVFQGDVLDAASVEAAMKDRQAVLCALGHRRYLGPTRILSEGTRNILHAMKANGVARIVCETSLGIGDSAGRLGIYYTLFVIPVILPFYFWDKTRQERIIAQSSADWVIVRPGALTNGGRRGRVRQGRGVGSYLLTARISRPDVAGFMLDQLSTDTHLRAAPGVCW